MKKIIVFLIFFASLIFLAIVFACYYSGVKSETIVFAHRSADVKGDKLIVMRVNGGEDISLEFFNINANQKSELLGSYGEYDLRAIYPLLKLDKKSDSFINASFSHSLKVLVSKVIALEIIPKLESRKQVKQLFLDLCLDRYGKLSLKDKFKLIKLSLRMNDLAIEVDDIDKLEELEFDEDASDCSVALINTTAKNGLGKDIAELIEKNGFRVVKIDDSEENREESKIFLAQNEARCAQLSESLYRVLPANGKINLDESFFAQHRADIVIFLGNDLVD